MKGTVTAIFHKKGFGFIRDEEGRDRFFHARAVHGSPFDTVQEGTAVEFEPYEQQPLSRVADLHARTPSDNGLRAREVRVTRS